MGGGSSWGKHDTLFACKSFERASENSKKGNFQKKEVFNASVYDEYASLIFEALDSDAFWIKKAKAEKMLERTPLGVVARARKVETECLKFDGMVHTVKAAKPTCNPTTEDIENAALAIYNGD